MAHPFGQVFLKLKHFQEKQLTLLILVCLIHIQPIFGYFATDSTSAIRMNYAYFLFRSGKLEKAEVMFNKALVLSEKEKDWYNFLWSLAGKAYIALDKKDFLEANAIENQFQLAIKKHPQTDSLIYSDFQFIRGQINRKAHYQVAMSAYLESIRIRKSLGMNDTILLKAYNNLGLIYSDICNYPRAKFYLHEKIKGIIALEGEDSPRLGSTYQNLGAILAETGNYQEALKYYELAENVLLKNFGRNYYGLASIYVNEANIFKMNGDYEKARTYFITAIDLLEKNPTIAFNPIGSVYNNLGIIYSITNQLDKAIEYTHRAIEAQKKNNPYELPYLTRSLAYYYLALNDFNKSESLYKQAIVLAGKYPGETQYRQGTIYQGMAGLYKRMPGKLAQCLPLYEKAYTIFQSNLGSKHVLSADCLLDMGSYYLQVNKPTQGLQCLQKAIIAVSDQFSDSTSYSNPSLEDIKPFMTSVNILKAKAIALLNQYKKDRSTEMLAASQETFELAAQMIDKIRHDYMSEQSRLILSANEKDTYEHLVEVCYGMYAISHREEYIEKAFRYAEHTKAAALITGLQIIEASQMSGIPAVLTRYEDQLKQEISFYKEAVYEERRNARPDAAKINIFEESIQRLTISYDSLIRVFEREYPDYNHFKNMDKLISYKELRDRLSRNEVLLEYFTTDSTLFIFSATRNSLKVVKTPIDSTFSESLTHFLSILKSGDFIMNDVQSYRDFTRIGHHLFNLLLGPVWKDIKTKELIIVPDGLMAYLPFEVLLISQEDDQSMNYRELSFLIKDNVVSYAFSASIFAAPPPLRFSLRNRLLALAPSYKEGFVVRSMANPVKASYRNNLQPLPGAVEEVEKISSLFRSTVLLDDEATERTFKNTASGYTILHLAMHTIIDDQNPMFSKLVFTSAPDSSEDGFLNTYEIYNLKLKARLAMLSSCNSGTGKLQKGEGVMSLARGFIYAGCPSIVMSLWEIEDATSVSLVEDFYKSLSRGAEISTALRKAKLDFLKNSDPLTAHPYFWSGFVVIGAKQQVTMPCWPLATAGGFILVVIILLLYRKKSALLIQGNRDHS
jgi:CHAT domain-containing protein/tetratricopeptide (TPR) repeat protein